MYLLPTLAYLTFPLMIVACYFGAIWVIKKYNETLEDEET